MGHAGSDVESSYRTQREIRADLARDPLLRTARLLVEAGLVTPEQLLNPYESSREHVLRIALETTRSPRLVSATRSWSRSRRAAPTDRQGSPRSPLRPRVSVRRRSPGRCPSRSSR